MIEMFNSKRIKYRINIADGFPENVLLKIMEPYLKTYLLANYSYEDTLLIRYRNILTNKLREFHKNNMIHIQSPKFFFVYRIMCYVTTILSCTRFKSSRNRKCYKSAFRVHVFIV